MFLKLQVCNFQVTFGLVTSVLLSYRCLLCPISYKAFCVLVFLKIGGRWRFVGQFGWSMKKPVPQKGQTLMLAASFSWFLLSKEDFPADL